MTKTEKIQRALFESDVPMSTDEVAEAIGEGDVPRQVEALLYYLVKQGKVMKPGPGLFQMTTNGRLWLREADSEDADLAGAETRKANSPQAMRRDAAIDSVSGRKTREGKGLRAQRTTKRVTGSPGEPAPVFGPNGEYAPERVSGFVIERGVPLPPARRGRKYAPLAEAMQPGDSVLLPTVVAANGLRHALRMLKRGASATRRVDGGVRVWLRGDA